MPKPASLVQRINREVRKKSLLKHPFYQMWSKGELDKDDLRGYSKEYFQLVKAVPQMVSSTLDKSKNLKVKNEIKGNLREEIDHIGLWIRFASSLGIEAKDLSLYKGGEKTNEAVRELNLESASFEEAVATLYAYELELPKISASKIDGLNKFYGLKSRDALIYFETHEKADIAHAAVWRKILQNFRGKKKEAAFKAAIRSLHAQNKLLDSVMEAYVN